ncbi:hypothetical protein PCASD_12999 [Puccinia coronata f. sp. avenae]|uniref:Uncharacterized protein n=1 Tax=Puccinia coronata f. sp. avenae TaxID=200324 RepID=A0A2N5UBJ9_9BASI|nr:hypothetical protein PCASD_12999 [Puccinia coronata f. sp. avenae]
MASVALASGKFEDQGEAGTFLGYDHPAPTVSDSNLFTIFIDNTSDNESPGENGISNQPETTNKTTGVGEVSSDQSTKDLDFFDSNSLIPSTAEADLSTIDQAIATQPMRDGPIHEIIGDVCEQNVIPGRL